MPRCANLPTITPERLSLLALAWLAPQPTLANFANRGRCSRLLLRYSLRIPIATRLAGLAWLASLANRLKPLIIKAFGSVVGKLARCANRLRSLRNKGFGNVVGRLAQRSFLTKTAVLAYVQQARGDPIASLDRISSVLGRRGTS